ncbi:MAG: Xaa-Pro aminopeptidase [Bacteroidetes bacterium CG2_30_33_31]|nr:MAG: Xaa-Pro aminopeptidase [Bacteroidetes bacterium CG2_30_33_31]
MFNKEVYQKRRSELSKSINNGIILLLGNVDSPMNYPGNIYEFRQDSTFLYFFGLDHPGYAAIIDIDENENYIFGDDIDIDDIIWMGPQPSIKDKASEIGVDKVKPFKNLFDYIKSAQNNGRKIHFLPPYRPENKLLLQDLTGIKANETKANASLELIKAVVKLRSIKGSEEIDHIEKIMDIGYEMHTTSMKMAHEGIYEREIAGTIEGIALKYGGRISFPVILSRRGETLHNHDHSNLLKNGDLLLTDAGFESSMHYATDNTRTFPVGGKFSQKQREIYEIVLATNNAVHKAVKPGIFYKDVHTLAAKTIFDGLKNLGLTRGNTDEAVAAGAHALFMPHGLGHMMGLDVHDMEDLGENIVGYEDNQKRSEQFGTAYLRLARELKPGFVLTDEPGIYFIPALIDKWINEKINNQYINFEKVNQYRDFGGIRLEDDILVTTDGGRNLGRRRIPITIDEVEEMIRSGK